ncbi:MAG: hypothetical protein ABL864_04485 [Terricaulis sp.]
MLARLTTRLLTLGIFLLAFGAVENAHARPALPRDMEGDEFAWFYNQPGVALQQYRQDEALCATLRRQYVSQGQYGQGLVTDIFAAAMSPGRDSAQRDNCMRTRGYRRFEIRPGNQRAFMQRLAQSGEEVVENYVSSPNPPEGTLAVEWHNEYMDPGTSVYARETLNMPAPGQPIARSEAAGINFFYLRSHSAREIVVGDAYEPDMATIVLAMTTPSGERVAFNRDILAFLKIEPESGNVPLLNGHPTFINLGQWNRERVPERFQVFRVPAGRYALWRFVDTGNRAVDFCLRTIAFDVRAGEAVYAGRWRLAEGQPLNLSMADSDDARNALRQISPELADSMQLATYVNGVKLPCSTYYLPEYFFSYGIDLPVRTP